MRIALLISGGGTTATAIIEATRNGRLAGVIPALVIASRADCAGIARLKEIGFPEHDIVIIDPKTFATSEEFGAAILAECTSRRVEFVGQYGWMVKTPENVVAAYEGKMVNQHPGPLFPGHPDFGGKGMYGMRVHAARLYFVRKVNRDFWSEATAQRVAVNFDEGAVLKMKRVPIEANDTPEDLQKRMLPIEHQVHIETLADFVHGTVSEYQRQNPLVLPSEEEILEKCKEEAIKNYPNG